MEKGRATHLTYELASELARVFEQAGLTSAAQTFREEAARRKLEAPPPRREAEGQAFDWMAERDGMLGRPQADAPPPPAPFVTDHKWLDPECHASGCQTLILKAEIEKLRDQRDKYVWQVRDTCRRAEAAEADAKWLREALDFYACIDHYPDGSAPDVVRADKGAKARAALAQGGNDG